MNPVLISQAYVALFFAVLAFTVFVPMIAYVVLENRKMNKELAEVQAEIAQQEKIQEQQANVKRIMKNKLVK